jgi:hypothetical protein
MLMNDGTDFNRWTKSDSLLPQWDGRASYAAQFIPAGSTVLDLGCGAMALERCLPLGCTYIPFDLCTRDHRTLVGNLNQGDFPAEAASNSDVITLLGVIEYIVDAPELLKKLRPSGARIIFTYHPPQPTHKLDRASLGWLNSFSLEQIFTYLARAGFRVETVERMSDIQYLIKAHPIVIPNAITKNVVVLSYGNVGNFGDRLGFHLIRSALPPEVNVKQAYFQPWVDLGNDKIDLLVLGTGNSIYMPMLTDELQTLVERAEATVGIFGTQYRSVMPMERLSRLMSKLDVWFARYEEDIKLYGDLTGTAAHLGDWLIDEFSMSVPDLDETLKIGRGLWDRQHLDLTIKAIQRYKRVVSPRLHPLLCALTSAEEFEYSEQREFNSEEPSGKFRSMFLDIFGRDFSENTSHKIDRRKVIEYKVKVRKNIETMRVKIEDILNK